MNFQGVSLGSLYAAGGERKYLTATERERFIQAAYACPRPKLRSLCLVLVYTGCRISEALALTARAIETESGFIAIRSLKKRTKTWIVREVPIPPDLIQLLESTHDLSSDNADARLWPWSRGRAWQLVKSVFVSAGIRPGIHATPKGLRHGFGLHAVRSGIPLNLVQRWLGHASMKTTAIYLDAIGEEEREIAARMWTTNDIKAEGILRESQRR